MMEGKSYHISQQEVYDAYRRVQANHGAAGVDGESLEDFERKLEGNLYKIWNRLSSGSYFPPPVRKVEIPKRSGGMRPLGIPTVSDRIAQTVVKTRLEPVLEPHFHADSYAYRQKKSALDAVGQARRRCWKYDWVIDVDIQGFFDSIDHELLMKAVERHVKEPWIILYITRWLKAPVEDASGQVHARTCGTPQGGVISPLLANLFLHYVFDKWMEIYHRSIPFERYADDIIVHCRSREEAEQLLAAIDARMTECHLKLHPEKTKIVYCKDDGRKGTYPRVTFDFLGYTFRPRPAKSKPGTLFYGFLPAVSRQSAKAMRERIRSWKLHMRSDASLETLSSIINPVVRGWITYYGRFYHSALYPILQHIDHCLVRWLMRKCKKLHRSQRRARIRFSRIQRQTPTLFVHWQLSKIYGSLVGAV